MSVSLRLVRVTLSCIHDMPKMIHEKRVSTSHKYNPLTVNHTLKLCDAKVISGAMRQKQSAEKPPNPIIFIIRLRLSILSISPVD